MQRVMMIAGYWFLGEGTGRWGHVPAKTGQVSLSKVRGQLGEHLAPIGPLDAANGIAPLGLRCTLRDSPVKLAGPMYGHNQRDCVLYDRWLNLLPFSITHLADSYPPCSAPKRE